MTHTKHMPLRDLYRFKYANWAYLGIVLRAIALARLIMRSPETNEDTELLYTDALLNTLRSLEVEGSLYKDVDDPRYVVTGRFYEDDYKNVDRKVWLRAVIRSLIEHARHHNETSRWFGETGHLLTDTWSDELDWKAKIERDYDFQMDDGAGVSLWSMSNCHIVVAHGIAYPVIGYHAYNLYNYFSKVPYLWNDYLKENGYRR